MTSAESNWSSRRILPTLSLLPATSKMWAYHTLHGRRFLHTRPLPRDMPGVDLLQQAKEFCPASPRHVLEVGSFEQLNHLCWLCRIKLQTRSTVHSNAIAIIVRVCARMINKLLVLDFIMKLCCSALFEFTINMFWISRCHLTVHRLLRIKFTYHDIHKLEKWRSIEKHR